jgi:hypothetical protein
MAGCKRPEASGSTPPAVDPSIAVPADGGGVLLHAYAAGTQSYACARGTNGGYAWTFAGPEAELRDQGGGLIGHHFASEPGGGAPRWEGLDGSYVVGQKVAAVTPDGGAQAVPWLLLRAVAHGGTGPLASAHFVQRVATQGGLAPATACDASVADNKAKVPYTAEYFFYGP